MKLTSAVKTIAIVLIIVSGCRYQSEQDLIRGNWHYVNILKSDSSMVAISDDDYFNLDSHGVFHYQIQSVKKNMTGSWKYDNDTLHLHYQQPDTIRHFKVDLLSRRDLEISENGVKFKFKRTIEK